MAGEYRWGVDVCYVVDEGVDGCSGIEKGYVPSERELGETIGS